MLLRDNRKRALKGFLYSDLIDSKTLYVVASSILLGYVVLTTLILVLTASYGSSSNSNGGALNVGFVTTAISMFISAIVMSVGKERKSHFAFPIDRLTYTTGNLIMFALNTAGLLMLTTAAYVIETLTFRVLPRIFNNIVVVNIVDFETYFVGLWLSFWYIMLITTLTYFVFMLFARFKLKGIVVFGLLVIVLLYFASGRGILLSTLQFFTAEKSIALLSLKLICSTLILQVLSFLPLRNLEVNR